MGAPAQDRGVQVTVVSGQAACVIRLTGIIDESLDPKQMGTGGARAVVFDLDGVKRITSYGVREWTRAISALSADYLCFVRCRPAIVSQFNMVSGFAGRGELVSFYAPYACPACQHTFDLLIDLRKEHARVQALSPIAAPCPACGAAAELDDLLESFFSFAASRPAPRPPFDLDLTLAPKTGLAQTQPLRVRKLVDGNVTGLWFLGPLDGTARLKRLGDGLEGPVLLIADGLKSHTPEGVAQLGALLATPGPSFQVARLPLELLGILGERGPGTPPLLSIRVTTGCSQCNEVGLRDVDAAAFERARQGKPLAQCARCGGGLHLLLGAGGKGALESVVWTAPSPEVAEFLDKHRAAPQEQRGDSGSLSASDSTPTGEPFGRYQLIRLLGAGGMAEVFLARQTSVGGFEKTVVVKRILPHLSADQAFVEMFFQEARLSARISHPNVVQIFDLGQVGDRYYIAMEYVRGWDLNTILRLCQRLNALPPVPVAARIVADMCAGLEAAHTCTGQGGEFLGIVHRDVSPHNVLLSSGGVAKITDFGVAKAMDTGSRTPTDTLKGKIAYMAPEQVRMDGAKLDGRVDIFAAGVILYQCLTLEHLFKREAEFATLKAILHDPVPAIRARRPEAPAELDAILGRALARKLEDRYPSAALFQKDLERMLGAGGAAVTASDVAQWTRDLLKQGQIRGELPPEMVFTPTGGSPTRDPTAPTRPGSDAGKGPPKR